MSSIKLTSDTLAVSPAGGELEYNGQFFGTDSNNSRAQLQRLVRDTAKSATGTAVDFTGIPSWVKRITIMFNGVSTNGTSFLQIQLGSGTFTTTGYLGTTGYINNANVTATTNITTGLGVGQNNSAADVRHGVITITNVTGNTWTSTAVMGLSNLASLGLAGGAISLSGTLDRIRITTVNGTDTFDAGTINILYEG